MEFGPQAPERLDVRACLSAIAVGLIAGALAISFRTALSFAETLHNDAVKAVDPYGALGWLVLAALAVVVGGFARWLVARFAPETAGSGIPGVEARLQGTAPMHWRRILPVKFSGGLASIATGMSLGREGPTVQLGAAVGEAVGEIAARTPRLRKALVAAGAGAGLTGAFNAPIAGFLFIIEELRWEMTPLTYVTGFFAALSCQLLVGAFFGPEPLLGVINPPTPSWWGLAAAAVVGLACGLVGIAYNRSIFLALDLFARWRSVPLWVHGAAAAVFAVVVAYWLPAALFGSDAIVGEVVNGSVADLAVAQAGSPAGGHLAGLGPLEFLLLLAVVKMVLTAVSYGSGVVGGLFAPQLVIGAVVGGAIGEAMRLLALPPGADPAIVTVLAAAGAVGVFTASVRVPVTGIVLVLEMTGATNQAFPLTIAAAVAFLVATVLHEDPIYEVLGRRIVATAGTTADRA